MANLYGLWDWVGMAPCMGPMSPVRAHSLWAGLCPEKLVKLKKKLKKLNQKLIRVHFVADSFRPRCLGNGKRFFLRDFPFTKTRWRISLFIRWLNSSFNNLAQSHILCWCCVLFVRIACAQPHPSYSGCRRLFMRGFRFRSSLNHDPREKVKDETKN